MFGSRSDGEHKNKVLTDHLLRMEIEIADENRESDEF